MRNIA